MRILVLSTLFPNAITPQHGVFVENRLRALKDYCNAEIKVIAPVPWFPFSHQKFGRYADFARVPGHETRHGIEITHPRYALPPKIGMTYAPLALERCFRKEANALISKGWDFDLIDAHYYYPDGVAAVRLAKSLGKPVTVTARGTDVNFIPQYKSQKAMILEAISHADHSITVAEALRSEMISLGASAETITTYRNGVDLEQFRPSTDREQIRKNLGLDGPVIASIGHLIERKGHNLVIEALKNIPNATLLIAGDGPEKKSITEQVTEAGLEKRVRFLGVIAHDKLYQTYNAADILVLASSREGWPNVLLEAMACGTPCVATPVWGSGEVIKEPRAGKLCDARTPDAIASSVNDLLTSMPSRLETRQYAEQFSWRETSEGLHKLFSKIITNHQKSNDIRCKPFSVSTKDLKPKAIVTIDTEESFDWDQFNQQGFKVCDVEHIDRFQRLCENHTIKPLYFITQPLLQTEKTANYYAGLVTTKKAHAGLHLHQWVTTPLPENEPIDYTSVYYSFQKNLPDDLHREKLASLIRSFKEIFGHDPTMHRAGRYGISPKDYLTLHELGITHDFSPSAGFDFSHEGGPDFSNLDNAPFVIYPNPNPNEKNQKMVVLPVCGANAIQHTRKFSKRSETLGYSSVYTPPKLLNPPSIPMRLSPEGAKTEDLYALAKNLINKKLPVLTFTLHSTSLTPGANDYAKDESSVVRLLSSCDSFFTFFKEELGGEFIDADQLKDFLKT